MSAPGHDECTRGVQAEPRGVKRGQPAGYESGKILVGW